MLAPPFTTVGSRKLGFHPGNTRIGCVDKQEDTSSRLGCETQKIYHEIGVTSCNYEINVASFCQKKGGRAFFKIVCMCLFGYWSKLCSPIIGRLIQTMDKNLLPPRSLILTHT